MLKNLYPLLIQQLLPLKLLLLLLWECDFFLICYSCYCNGKNANISAPNVLSVNDFLIVIVRNYNSKGIKWWSWDATILERYISAISCLVENEKETKNRKTVKKCALRWRMRWCMHNWRQLQCLQWFNLTIFFRLTCHLFYQFRLPLRLLFIRPY